MKFTKLSEKKPEYLQDVYIIRHDPEDENYYWIEMGYLDSTSYRGDMFKTHGGDDKANNIVAWAYVKLPKEYQ